MFTPYEKMTNKFVVYKSMNKRQRAALDKQKRNTWEFSPTMRVKESKKIYSRKKKVNYDE